MRNEEIIIDLADPVFTKTIRSRQNDKNGLKITVNVREKGQLVDLTGYAVKYEAINQVGLFVRDDAQIVDAKNGVFSYTLSSQAVSTSDDWTAYFVMEKSTERMSTPDIRITLRRDVKEGNIKIENYISEFDKALEMIKGYQKQIDEANKRVNELTAAVTGQKYQLWKVTDDDGTSIDLAANTDLNTILKTGTYVGSQLKNTPNASIYTFFVAVESATNAALVQKATLLGNWNDTYIRINNGGKWSEWSRMVLEKEVVPKTGGAYTGTTHFNTDNAIVIGSRSFKTVLHKGAQGQLVIAPSTKEQEESWDWTKRVEIRTDGTIRQATDTDWIKLAITGAENVANRDMKYKRSGENISVIGSVRNPQNEAVFSTLPVGFRPVQHIAFPALAYGYTPAVCEVTIKPDGGIFVNGVPSGSTVHIAMSFLI
ncbi:BppU family phage baseplate upper protein [Bacillus cereus]|uniref:BppU family phage baseplate upper protein n=2 Tax=Bacillus cereus group TaxID=86661 RepID=UPI0035CA3157